jgi:hypothetical protein
MIVFSLCYFLEIVIFKSFGLASEQSHEEEDYQSDDEHERY